MSFPQFLWKHCGKALLSVDELCTGVKMMYVNNQQEALYIACEMEKRAIRLYQRAVMLLDDPVMKAEAEEMVQEETQHLQRFRQMGEQLSGHPLDEGQLILSAFAAQILYPGGLVEASREHAFEDRKSLLTVALNEEKSAIKWYAAFAKECTSKEAQEMFLNIAAEEVLHMQVLEDKLENLNE